MTDKELLELAAKAAGLVMLTRDCDDGAPSVDDVLWNPLTDDGDALRLAVKLCMDFTLSGKHAAIAQSGGAMAQEYCNGDPHAATRRAIVRAAAIIGKAMP